MKNIFHLTELREKGEWLGWAGLGWAGRVAATSKHRNTNMEYFARPVVSVAPGPTFHTMSPVIFIVAILMYLHSPGSSTLAQGYNVSSLQCSLCLTTATFKLIIGSEL